MNLTLDNLRRGIAAFKSRWPQEKDLHAGFYKRLQSNLTDGVTEGAWSKLVDDLSAWRALRPLSKSEAFERGLARLPLLETARRSLIADGSETEPSINTAKWSDAAPLYDIARSIKGSSSPVFPSKLCHFLAPRLYPVCDGEFAGTSVRGYRNFWSESRLALISCVDLAGLQRELEAVLPGASLDGYPWETKIIDLCCAGEQALAERQDLR